MPCPDYVRKKGGVKSHPLKFKPQFAESMKWFDLKAEFQLQ